MSVGFICLQHMIPHRIVWGEWGCKVKDRQNMKLSLSFLFVLPWWFGLVSVGFVGFFFSFCLFLLMIVQYDMRKLPQDRGTESEKKNKEGEGN